MPNGSGDNNVYNITFNSNSSSNSEVPMPKFRIAIMFYTKEVSYLRIFIIIYLITNISSYYTSLTRKRNEQHTQELFWEQEERPQ